MAKRLMMRKLFLSLSIASVLSLASNNAMASAFELWEQDGASVGNYHAGRAAIAEDASTAFYNPAGLVRMQNQEVVVAADPIVTDFKYSGTIAVNTMPFLSPNNFNAQGGTFNVVPSAHYAAPINTPLNKRVVFGLSLVSPFGLVTDYGNDTLMRYAATLSSLKTFDIAPSLGVAITDQFSVGAGADIEWLGAHLDLTGGLLAPGVADTQATNSGSDTGYGYHLGALYQFTPRTRLGIAYQSKIVHHIEGTSHFEGPIANLFGGGSLSSQNFEARAVLPPITTVSLFHSFNPCWDLMGSISYTQWSLFKNVVLHNVAGIAAALPPASTAITVVIPENYSNSWNYAVGGNYHLSDRWMFRGGLGYDQSPSNDVDRNAQLPDSSRIAAAIGGHYQPTNTWGFDLSWNHFFVMNTRLNNHVQAVGAQTTTLNGSVHSRADVFGLQVKWDMV